MRRMILFSLLVFSSIVKAGVEMEAVSNWLNSIDNGFYQKSWESSAPYFQSQVTESNWVSKIVTARNQFGEIISRKLIASQAVSNLPNAPEGKYKVMTYHSKFTNKSEATETVTFMQVDNAWKAVGYYIR